MAPRPHERARGLLAGLVVFVVALALHLGQAGTGFLRFERPDSQHPFSAESMAATSIAHVLAPPRAPGDEPLARIAHRVAWSLGAHRAPDARAFDAWLFALGAGALTLGLAASFAPGSAAFVGLAIVLGPGAAGVVAYTALRGFSAGLLLAGIALLLSRRGRIGRSAAYAFALALPLAHPYLLVLAPSIALTGNGSVDGQPPRRKAWTPALLLFGAALVAGLAFPLNADRVLLTLSAIVLLTVGLLASAPLEDPHRSAKLAARVGGTIGVTLLVARWAFGREAWRVEDSWWIAAEVLFTAFVALELVVAAAFLGARIPSLRRGSFLLAGAALAALLPWTRGQRAAFLDDRTLAEDEAETGGARRLDSLLVAGYDAIYRGRLTEARDYFREANERAPGTETLEGCAAAWTGLGILETRLPDLTQARVYFEKAVALEPDDVMANQRLGEVFQRLGDQASLLAAVEHLRVAVEGAPYFLRARTRLAVCLALLHRPGEARLQVDAALAIDPRAREAWLARGMAEELDGDATAALEAYREALACEPDYAEALVSVGRLELEAGELDAALSTLERAYELHPLYPDVLYQLARAKRAAGSLEEAASFYEDTLVARPGHMRATVELGEVELALGRIEEARARAKAALAINPNHAGARSLLSDVALAAGNWVGAAAQLEAAVAANPDRSDLALRWIRLLAAAPDARVRDGQRALEEVERLQPSLGDTPALLSARGAAFAETGRFGEAVRALDRALAASDPGDAALRAQLEAERERYRQHEPLRFGEDG